MRVLLVGSGGREHALAWKIGQSPLLEELFIAPGNAGTASVGTNLSIQDSDINGLSEYATSKNIDLTIVGPEGPLAAGLVDKFSAVGLKAFGPNRKAAQLEWSKTFAKTFMKDNDIPTSDSLTVNTRDEAVRAADAFGLPVVLKADGLAAGKGVYICESVKEVRTAIDDIVVKRIFGKSGDSLVIEEYLTGSELSVFAFSDGKTISPLVAACDYKRIGNYDQGPNTGGMGAYSPAPFWNPSLEDQIGKEVVEKTLLGMQRIHNEYSGVLFVGLMVTESGPKVLEFNCRLGDPETQTIMPLLEADILEMSMACIDGDLESVEVKWSEESCVTVVLASEGYPATYETGFPITGLENVSDKSTVFHAGTILSTNGTFNTSGGRVLSVSSKGRNLNEAKMNTYGNINKIEFKNSYFRNDIALGI